MIETYYTAAYWEPREDPKQACAESMLTLLAELAQCHDLFKHWYLSTDPKTGVLQNEVMYNVEFLNQALLDYRSYPRNLGLTANFGYSAVMQTAGADGEFAHLTIKCGRNTAEFGRNSCVLKLPTRTEIANQLLEIAVLRKIVVGLISAWKPDWAVVDSHAYRQLVANDQQMRMRVGWLTYISDRLGTVAALPEPAEISRIQNFGTLITLTNERFTVDNQGHLRIASNITNILSQTLD